MSASETKRPNALGTAELRNLKSIRTLVETHVRETLRRIEKTESIAAAADPYEFIDASWVDQFGLLAEDLWEDGFDTVDEMFRVRTRTPLPPRRFMRSLVLGAVEDARNSYLDLVKELAAKHAYRGDAPVYGEFRNGSAVQYGDVRGLLVKLGGGSSDPQVPLHYGGVTTGQMMQDFLGENDINTDQKIWLYGWEEQPRRTFNGHLQMDGLVFEEWDDNGLIISPQDRWLRRNYYAPGDHWGCACIVSPYFPNMDESFEI